jgi:hypothetical protein
VDSSWTTRIAGNLEEK